MVEANNVNQIGTWTATVAFAPASTDTASLALTVDRTRHSWTAVLWALLGALLASLAGFLANLIAMTKARKSKPKAVAATTTASDHVVAAIRRNASWFPNGASLAVANWSRRLSGDDALAKGQRLDQSAQAAIRLIRAIGAEIEPLSIDNPLTHTLVTALSAGPSLDASVSPLVTAENHARPLFQALQVIQAGLTDPDTNKDVLRAKRDEILGTRAEALHDTHRSTKILAAVISACGTWPRPHTSARLGLISVQEDLALGRPVASAAPAVADAAASHHTQATKTRRQLIWLEAAAFVVALAVGVAIILATKYYSQATWGTTGDILSALTWSFGAAGVVQVTKIFSTTRPLLAVTDS
jgi:hypothetical protein